MRHVDHGEWPGLVLTTLRGEELRARRPRIYRTCRPRWLWPTIDITPNPQRCRFCTAQRFDLLAGDYDIIYDGPPRTPLAMSVCTFDKWCRYRIVLMPQPWHDFGPVPTCVGYKAAYRDRHQYVVDLAHGKLPWWPGHPPSEPQRTRPTNDELIAYAGYVLITPEIRELNRTNQRQAHKQARELLKERGGFSCFGGPQIDVRSSEIRIWNITGSNVNNKAPVVLPLKEFLARALPVRVVQTRLI